MTNSKELLLCYGGKFYFVSCLESEKFQNKRESKGNQGICKSVKTLTNLDAEDQ